MNKTTFKDYKLAIKEQYVFAKEKDVSGILENPTPAQLREFCRFIYEKGVSRNDEEVFRLFFEAKEGEIVKKAIDRVAVDKFKTIISFLKTEKDTDIRIRVELAAIMVDFKERPYRIFSKTEQNEVVKDPIHVALPVITQPEGHQPEKEISKSKGFAYWLGKNKLITIFLIIASLLGGFSLAKFVFTEKQCMQWQNDHYEVVDCTDSEKNPLENTIVPLDKKLLNFRKVEVSDTTTFFNKQGKPLYWYCKVNGKPEFFNEMGDGIHPETGKRLNQISHYIIDKYVMEK